MKNKNVVSRQEFATELLSSLPRFLPCWGKPAELIRSLEQLINSVNRFSTFNDFFYRENWNGEIFAHDLLRINQTIMEYRCVKKSKAKERRLKRKNKFFRKPSKMRSFRFFLVLYSSFFFLPFLPPFASVDNPRFFTERFAPFAFNFLSIMRFFTENRPRSNSFRY